MAIEEGYPLEAKMEGGALLFSPFFITTRKGNFMGLRFYQKNEKPMRFMAPISEPEWNEVWGCYWSAIDISKKILSDCGQEVTIDEEYFPLLITKDMYKIFTKRLNECEIDYYGRYLWTLDADLYQEIISNNAKCHGHYLEVLQMAPYPNDLPPYILPIPEREIPINSTCLNNAESCGDEFPF